MRGRLTAGLLLTLGCVLPIATGCGSSQTPSVNAHGADLRLELNPPGDAEVATVDILGLTEAERDACLQLAPSERAAVVSLQVADGGDLPTVGGEFSGQDEALRFTPRYPLPRGMRYRVAINRSRLASDPAHARANVTLEFATAPAVATPTTEISQIYPTRSELPENQLKFYIHFSGPMNRGDSYRHIHLLDADGQELEAVFLELAEELWDADLRRFTLLCDPGRVKRGLVPREELGSVLQAGKDYTLVVDADWRDAAGKPLAATVRKKFHVLPPDHAPIDTARWKIDPPKAGARDPLVVTFAESLDHSLAQRMLRVQTTEGEQVVGAVEIVEAETRWQFTPVEPWPSGDYHIVIDTALEDLAGNAIGRAFDADTSAPVGKPITENEVAIPFSIR